jgi:clan AA aspartic protease
VIAGSVNAELEATIPLEIHGRRVSNRSLRVVVDTGFDGWLTLPRDVVNELQLALEGHGQAILADGSTVPFDMYSAVVVWDGQERRVPVAATESVPLLGMPLLHGHELLVRVRSDGEVLISALE